MATRRGTKPWSPSPCTVGGRRTAMARTPRGAKASAASSETRGNPPGGRTISSVETCPGRRSATPEVAMNGRSELARVSPIASMARWSMALLSTIFAKSWMKAQWITPSDPAAPRLRLSRSSSEPRWTSAPAASSLSAGVRTREADDRMRGADQFGDDGRADKAGGAGDKDAHGSLLPVLSRRSAGEIAGLIDVGDEPGLLRRPAEKGARARARRRRIPAGEAPEPAEVARSLIGRYTHDRDVQQSADRRRDVAERNAFVGDGVEGSADSPTLDRKAIDARRVETVDGGPAVEPFADIGGDALLAGDGVEHG